MTIILLVIICYLAYKILNVDKHKRPRRGGCSASNISMNTDHPAPRLDDYGDYLMSTGLEQSVVDSHQKFVKDVQRTTTGASPMSVYSEEPDQISWVGLRRPDYHSVRMDPAARQVPGIDPATLPANRKVCFF